MQVLKNLAQSWRLNWIFSLVLSKHTAMNEVCKKLAFTFGAVSKKVLSFLFFVIEGLPILECQEHFLFFLFHYNSRKDEQIG